MSTCSDDESAHPVEPEFLWDAKSELALYQTLLYYKPAGINKHFNVALAAEQLAEQLGRPVHASAIWQKLSCMYDLKAVDDIEDTIPFSLEIKEFSLPRQDFETLILERQREWRHDKSRSRYFSSGGTPSTPKSEGSESRSSPVVSDEEDEVDSDVMSDDDEYFDNMDAESNKSDVKDVDLAEVEADVDQDKEKEQLISQAREEFESKLKLKQQKDEEKLKTTPKTEKKAEPRTPIVDAPKRHMTRSTPTSTPSSTPNKRRK